jgi:8-oxo-dGTP diphosphatase
MKKIQFCQVCGAKVNEQEAGRFYECPQCSQVFWKSTKPTAEAIILNDDGKVLLEKRKGSIREGFWDTPGGYLENGEDPIEGLRREVMEEIGVEVEVGKLINMSIEPDAYSEIENSYCLDITFEARITSGSPQPKDETCEVRWFAKEEIPWDKIGFPGEKKALKSYFKN